jgi:pimeloyl-ACP methyl ester carboxylesterase
MRLRRLSLCALLAPFAMPVSAMAEEAKASKAPEIVMEEFHIPSTDAGITLYVRNKRPAGIKKFPANKILLYVHGGGGSSETSFDLRLNGLSWMDYVAEHGYDAYLVDVRGFGASTWPPQMLEPAEKNPPVVNTADAIRDVSSAVDFIRKRRGVSKVDLLGWSWGTTIMAGYAAATPAKVEKLVLYAPSWLYPPGLKLNTTSAAPQPEQPLGAYRVETPDSLAAARYAGVPESKRADLIPKGWLDVIQAANFSLDPEGSKHTPPYVRIPNGMIIDYRDNWIVGKPLYDPADIVAPTLIVHAEWDAALPSSQSHELFARLTHTPYKRFVEFGEGTHAIIWEKNRYELFEVVQQFLDEEYHEGR